MHVALALTISFSWSARIERASSRASSERLQAGRSLVGRLLRVPYAYAIPLMVLNFGIVGYLQPVSRPEITRIRGDVSPYIALEPGDATLDLFALIRHHEVLAILRTRTRQDFSGYKKRTLLRRFQRREEGVAQKGVRRSCQPVPRRCVHRLERIGDTRLDGVTVGRDTHEVRDRVVFLKPV